MRSSIAAVGLVLIGLGLIFSGCGGAPPATAPTTPSAVVSPIATTEALPPPIVALSTLTPPPPTPATIASPTTTPTAVPPTATPPPAPTPTPTPERERLLALSAAGRPVRAERSGDGPWRALLAVNGLPLTDVLARAVADLPPTAVVWTVNELNPDRLPGFLEGADTSFDGCGLNNGVGRPFATAEARALRDAAAGATLIVLLEPGPADRIWIDTCRLQPEAQAAAERLGSTLGLPVAPLRRTTGHFIDYFAGEGSPAVLIQLVGSPPVGLGAALADLLADLPAVGEAAARSVGAAPRWLPQAATAVWRFAPNTLPHPLALAWRDDALIVLDTGRVLAFPGGRPEDGRALLQAGDLVGQTPVQEPLDLVNAADGLLVLDRAGDVYRLADGERLLERYDRPIGERSAHYYVALEAADDRRLLLETSAPLVLRYDATGEGMLPLPADAYPIDLAAVGDDLYALFQAADSPAAVVRRYTNGRESAWQPNLPVAQPRQVQATADALWLLDQDGRRLTEFGRADGRARQVFRFADGRRISSFWIAADGQTLALAGRDWIALVGGSAVDAAVAAEGLRVAELPHAAERLAALIPLHIPIGIPLFTQRDYQMPGAPRHYRLGIHEGVDFYWQTGAPVTAVAAGVVIRADWGYVDPPPAQFAYWRAQAAALGATPPEAIDFFRGRQVWIDHGDGLISRYVHLSAVDAAVQVGAAVAQGQVVGYVGNSGSPGALVDGYEDAHLHLELRIGDGFVGQFLRPIEAREWLRRLLR